MPTGDLASPALLREQNTRRVGIVGQFRPLHGYGPRPIVRRVLELTTPVDAIELLQREMYARVGPDPLAQLARGIFRSGLSASLEARAFRPRFTGPATVL
jgi:hypothetical protein